MDGDRGQEHDEGRGARKQAGGDTDYEPGESVAEAESEMGMSDWIDPDTGQPAEDSVPHIKDN